MDRPFVYTCILGVLAFIGLFMAKGYSFLLFHSLAEGFSIVIACGIFMLAWNTRRFMISNYLLFSGIAYLFIGGLDLVHTLGYKGKAGFSPIVFLKIRACPLLKSSVNISFPSFCWPRWLSCSSSANTSIAACCAC